MGVGNNVHPVAHGPLSRRGTQGRLGWIPDTEGVQFLCRERNNMRQESLQCLSKGGIQKVVAAKRVWAVVLADPGMSRFLLSVSHWQLWWGERRGCIGPLSIIISSAELKCSGRQRTYPHSDPPGPPRHTPLVHPTSDDLARRGQCEERQPQTRLMFWDSNFINSANEKDYIYANGLYSILKWGGLSIMLVCY